MLWGARFHSGQNPEIDSKMMKKPQIPLNPGQMGNSGHNLVNSGQNPGQNPGLSHQIKNPIIKLETNMGKAGGVSHHQAPISHNQTEIKNQQPATSAIANDPTDGEYQIQLRRCQRYIPKLNKQIQKLEGESARVGHQEAETLAKMKQLRDYGWLGNWTKIMGKSQKARNSTRFR